MIYGKKSFKDLNTTDVSIESLKCSKLCGEIISNLFNSSVNRIAAHQEVSLTNLSGIRSDRITIKGNLTVCER